MLPEDERQLKKLLRLLQGAQDSVTHANDAGEDFVELTYMYIRERTRIRDEILSLFRGVAGRNAEHRLEQTDGSEIDTAKQNES